MGAARARRWKLLPFHSLPLPSKAKHKPPPVPGTPSPEAAVEEEVPREFLCPILGATMADPVILPSGRTYERACVQACAELSVCPPGEAGEPLVSDGVVIPNDALRAAIRTWCARSGRVTPAAPSAAAAREAVLRAVPTPPAAAAAAARSSSNLSCSSRESASSTSTSSGSSSEITAVEVEVVRGKEVAKEAKLLQVGDAQEEVAVEARDEEEVEAAMAALRQATRESALRRRSLCGSRLLAAIRRVLLSPRHTGAARANAAAALANLCLEPENRVPIVRAGAVPALVGVLASGAAAAPEACEHAAGALFGLALHEGNRAAIGVLGAVPPLLALLTTRDHSPRARRDAGMALYHLSLAAVNQSKLARAPGAAKNLLSIAFDSTEPSPIRRLALMAVCNVAACAEGRTALMDADAVATVSAILSGDTHSTELEEWCVAVLYGMSRGSPRFRALARAVGADWPLILIAQRAHAGIHKEIARKALRAMLGLGDYNDGDLPNCANSEGDGGGSIASSVPVHRRRAASWGAPPAATPQNPHLWRSVRID